MDRLNEIAKKKATSSNGADNQFAKPLIQTLNKYPEEGVDFGNLVTYPPRVEPIPVKPVFLDIAWNFIEYPGKETTIFAKTMSTTTTTTTVASSAETNEAGQQEQRPQQLESGQKKGLFGSFWGRS